MVIKHLVASCCKILGLLPFWDRNPLHDVWPQVGSAPITLSNSCRNLSGCFLPSQHQVIKSSSHLSHLSHRSPEGLKDIINWHCDVHGLVESNPSKHDLGMQWGSGDPHVVTSQTWGEYRSKQSTNLYRKPRAKPGKLKAELFPLTCVNTDSHIILNGRAKAKGARAKLQKCWEYVTTIIMIFATICSLFAHTDLGGHAAHFKQSPSRMEDV